MMTSLAMGPAQPTDFWQAHRLIEKHGGSLNAPEGFGRDHYKIAANYGITPDQIAFYPDDPTIQKISIELGVTPLDAKSYPGELSAVALQDLDITPRRKPIILLRDIIPDPVRQATFVYAEMNGLRNWRMVQPSGTNHVYAFILLHEIAHVLLHPPSLTDRNSDRLEAEANAFAANQFNAVFSPQLG